MSRNVVILLGLTVTALVGPATCRGEDETVEGMVSVGAGGRRAIEKRDGTLVAVSNPERLRALPLGLRVLATGPRVQGGLRVNRVKLGVMADWEKAKARNEVPGGTDTTANLDAAAQALDKAVRDAITQGGLGMEGDALDVGFSKMIDGNVAAYEAASDLQFSDFAPAKTICRKQMAEYLAAQRQHRRSVDNFPPEIYPVMFKTTRSAVGIVEQGAPVPHGSGVLIGKDLVLTCDHNIGKREPWQLKVWFRYDGKDRDTYPVARVIREDWLDRFGQPLDFALLVLDTNAKGQTAAQNYPPATISLRSASRDDPVYAVGHPEGDRQTLHDNAFVRFPFRVDSPNRFQLEMLVGYEVERYEEAERARLLDEFRASYKPARVGKGYEFFSKKFGFRPGIGIDTHTFHGDSGAPVFDRGSLCLIGIVDRGAKEEDRPVRPSGYRFFEVAIPASLIVEALDEKVPNWRNDYHVQFCKDPTQD